VNPLDELISSAHPLLAALINGAATHASWDNRPTWDNWKNQPGPWNNQPTWDNWNNKNWTKK
jgi:hypothetical protein